jgi:alkylation response protein AidB-like acyl-CoA dehydrogenase
MSIDIQFEDHQTRLAAAAREVFARRNTPEDIREIEAGEVGFSPELWEEVANLGWLGINISVDYGGEGAGFLDLYPVFEELGRALVQGPYLDTVGLGANLLADVGNDGQKDAYLPAIARGDCLLSLALLESSGGFGPEDIELTATDDGDGYLLAGTKLLVGWVPSVSRMIVAARTSPGPDGVTLFLVGNNVPGLSKSRLANVSADALYEVTFDDVAVARDAVIGPVGGGWAPLARAMTKAAVLQAAMIVGAGQTVLDMTSQYAKDREQFGIPIGKNQAVQYMVSDILIDMHRADLLNRQAAFLIDAGKPHLREAAISVAFAKAASAHFHRQAHEVHAGVAFIEEHDLTLYSKHAKYWENNYGDARYYRELFGEVAL